MTDYLTAAKAQLEKAGAKMSDGQRQGLMIAAAQAHALIHLGDKATDIAESLREIDKSLRQICGHSDSISDFFERK